MGSGSVQVNYESLKVMDESYWLAVFHVFKENKMMACMPERPVKGLLQRLLDDSCANTNMVTRIFNLYAEWLRTAFLPHNQRKIASLCKEDIFDCREKLLSTDELVFSHADLMFLAFDANDVHFTAALVSTGLVQTHSYDYSQEARLAELDIQAFW